MKTNKLPVCGECLNLFTTSKLKQVVESIEINASDPDIFSTTINNQFLTSTQMLLKCTKQREERGELRLQILNLQRKVSNKQGKLTDSLRLLTLISQNRIPAINDILTAASNNGRSVSFIIDRVLSLLAGTFKSKMKVPHSVTKQFDELLLIFEISGPRGIDALAKGSIAASVTSNSLRLYRSRIYGFDRPDGSWEMSRFQASWDDTIRKPTIKNNMTFLPNRRERRIAPQTLSIDEVSIKKELCVSYTQRILGVACHSPGFAEITNPPMEQEHIEQIVNMIKMGSDLVSVDSSSTGR